MDKKRERVMGSCSCSSSNSTAGVGISSKGKVLKVFLGALLLFVAFSFLFAGIIVDHAAKTVNVTVATSAEMLKHWQWNGRGRDHALLHHGNSNFFNYVSKRRVPNGPDPIHNRKAVKTRQPPGA